MLSLVLSSARKLSENVVESLTRMGCPHPIYPHQIQGLDYEKILPVIKWLVKKLYESRDVRSETNRKVATYNYAISYTTGQDKDGQLEERRARTANLSRRLQVPRLFKRKNIHDIQLRDPKRVYSTLLEFNDPMSKEYYRKLLEGGSGDPASDQSRKLAKQNQSVFVGKKGEEMDTAESTYVEAPEGKKPMAGGDVPRKSSEEMARFEGEIEKITEHEGQVKGENIGKLFVENMQNIAETVAESVLIV